MDNDIIRISGTSLVIFRKDGETENDALKRTIREQYELITDLNNAIARYQKCINLYSDTGYG